MLALTGISTLFVGGASLSALRTLSERGGGRRRWLVGACVVGLVLNLVLLVWRGVAGPSTELLRHSFDTLILLATLISGAALASLWANGLRGLAGMLLPIAFVIQLGAWLVVNKGGTEANYRETWFVVHMISIAVGLTGFVLNGVAGMAYLAMRRVLKGKQPSPLLGKFAPLESLERFGRWSLVAAMPLFSFGILAGICGILHEDAGDRWAWATDPKIVASCIMWVLYAAVMGSSWLLPSFRGRRFATWSTSGLVLLAFTIVIVDLISPIHR
jgi:ABC-type transport system involved in cytochrome c biogenesis permease subunit